MQIHRENVLTLQSASTKWMWLTLTRDSSIVSLTSSHASSRVLLMMRSLILITLIQLLERIVSLRLTKHRCQLIHWLCQMAIVILLEQEMALVIYLQRSCLSLYTKSQLLFTMIVQGCRPLHSSISMIQDQHRQVTSLQQVIQLIMTLN